MNKEVTNKKDNKEVSYKVGQKIIISKEQELKSAINGSIAGTLKVGDEGFVTLNGCVKMLTGELKHKILPLEGIIRGSDYANLARIMSKMLNSELGLRDILEDNDIEMSHIENTLEEILYTIF